MYLAPGFMHRYVNTSVFVLSRPRSVYYTILQIIGQPPQVVDDVCIRRTIILLREFLPKAVQSLPASSGIGYHHVCLAVSVSMPMNSLLSLLWSSSWLVLRCFHAVRVTGDVHTQQREQQREPAHNARIPSKTWTVLLPPPPLPSAPNPL